MPNTQASCACNSVHLISTLHKSRETVKSMISMIGYLRERESAENDLIAQCNKVLSNQEILKTDIELAISNIGDQVDEL